MNTLKNRAFSLLEVILSLAILSIALVSLIALLPIGIQDYQNTKLLLIQERIADYVLTQYSLSDSRTAQEKTFYFNVTGDGANLQSYHYKAILRVTPPQGLPLSRLKLIQVQIQNRYGKESISRYSLSVDS